MADRVGSQQMNLTAVRRHDPYVADIVDSATQVAVYEYNSDTSQWQKTDMQGALFVYKRSGPPYHSFMVLNRLNTSNLLQPLTKDLEFQLQAPFLLYRTASGIIYGLWFFYENECCRLAALLESLCRSASTGGGGAAKGGSIDLLTLFRHASGPKSQPQQQPAAAAAGPSSRPETPRPADEQQGQITIADLFAKASKTGQVLIGKQTVRSISVSEVEDAMPDLGGRPWLSTQPPATAQPVVVVTSQSAAAVTSQSAAAVSPGAVPGATSAAGTTRHAGDVDRIQQLFKSDLKLTASEAAASSAPAAPVATPAPPAQPALSVQSAAAARLLDPAPAVSLMSPMMLSSLVTPSAVAAAGSISADSDAGKGGATVRSPVPGRPAHAQQDGGQMTGVTPLTRRQLVQAFNYLLKNDDAFIDQLHSAYVKSLADSFKRT